MQRTLVRLAGCCAALLLASCAARQQEARPGSDAAIILDAEDFTTGSNVLLEALDQKVPTLRVNRNAGACPVVMVRGQAIGRQTGSAAVYVDGTRMRDTCILLQLQTPDVSRVELYPTAGSGPPGMIPGPGGLIVVHLVR
jgi:hypothetical protein